MKGRNLACWCPLNTALNLATNQPTEPSTVTDGIAIWHPQNFIHITPRGQTDMTLNRYTSDSDTSKITVTGLHGMISITVIRYDGSTTQVDEDEDTIILTIEEAREVALGIVTVLR